jgi:hypothetical protein
MQAKAMNAPGTEAAALRMLTTVVAPTAEPTITADPQPDRTGVNVPINSAIAFLANFFWKKYFLSSNIVIL